MVRLTRDVEGTFIRDRIADALEDVPGVCRVELVGSLARRGWSMNDVDVAIRLDTRRWGYDPRDSYERQPLGEGYDPSHNKWVRSAVGDADRDRFDRDVTNAVESALGEVGCEWLDRQYNADVFECRWPGKRYRVDVFYDPVAEDC